ncbi:hydrogenase [Frankia sp. B2]|jgi:hydrogenase small subunit|uniref:Hydrogenase (NiFe) small subunit (HydA) n=1 Tax=Frankia casuarinae (strain DSM 45818 / CECT 9043 / HFP020203 / CcI3) TaxID=106370 RepID=Q2JE33_FRACC|nr:MULTISPECIES: hydrogenase [Frankia]ABD10459.1 hydrogenase (NiFe) small subunit (hydA) [Frankia casuarinae]OHV52005.1 hydrogenase [Frankia sp. CgIS1]ORT50927.1 hydrogenase [Frankia sp. KB5]TFE27629.1 hydrogenase [Frankia sp. B2]
MSSVLWFQGGACSGNTMSFLNADEPNVVDLITDFGLELLWHPSLGLENGAQARELFTDCARGERPVDIFVFEGSVIRGPNGTGGFDVFAERPMQDWVRELAARAQVVVAIGDCACWGGIPATAPNPTDSTGLQFHKRERGGFLGPDFRSRSGLPVVNIPGCPAHPDWITQIIVALATGRAADIALDELHRPRTFFTTFTQTGCTRAEYFEYKQSTLAFGDGTRKGCLFYEFGCRGPMTHSPCNRILWNRQSSKTRAGMPCIGCTEPEFPFFDLAPGTIFRTRKVGGLIPREVPAGSGHLGYLAHAAAARIVAPQWSKEDMFVV